MTDPLLVTPADACRMLACSDTHLRRLTARGLIEVRYEGTRRRVVVASLKEYVESLPDEPKAS